ncbi:MAG: hypothetical protein Q7K42_02210, partial [Candidatus Diapherotrites archaeon]|nr:hypothetical protein [Candidatus Diapherotrites archaeon]
MDARWRNLGIILVAIVLAFFVYSMFFGPKAESLNIINGVWLSKGITVDKLGLAELQKISALPASDLQSLKSSFVTMQSSFKQDSADYYLSNVYSKLSDYLLFSKKVEEKNQQLSLLGYDDPCTHVPILKERNSLEEQSLQALQELDKAVVEFNSKFPLLSSNLSLKEGKDMDSLNAQLASKKESTQNLEKLC